MTAALLRALALGALLAAAPALAARKALPPGERVDLNRATVAELMRLPGVGEHRARAIVAHRQRAPFRRPEDVVRVKGLGRAWFEKVKGNISAGPPAAAQPGAGAPPARP